MFGDNGGKKNNGIFNQLFGSNKNKKNNGSLLNIEPKYNVLKLADDDELSPEPNLLLSSDSGLSPEPNLLLSDSENGYYPIDWTRRTRRAGINYGDARDSPFGVTVIEEWQKEQDELDKTQKAPRKQQAEKEELDKMRKTPKKK